MTKKTANPWPAKLKAMRRSRGLTQAQAAKKMDVPLRTWINWENSHRNPAGTAQRLLKITFTELK